MARILKLLILFASGVFTSKALSSPYRNIAITAFSLLSAAAITIIVPKLIIKNAQAINEKYWLYKQEYEKKIDKLEEEINVLEEKNSELEQKNSVFGITENIITYILGLFSPTLTELIGDGMKEIRQRRKGKEEQEDKEKEKKRKKKKKKKKS